MINNIFAAEMIMKDQHSDLERQAREAWKWSEVKKKTNGMKLRSLLQMRRTQAAPSVCCSCC
jgi:hypothetical protein